MKEKNQYKNIYKSPGVYTFEMDYFSFQSVYCPNCFELVGYQPSLKIYKICRYCAYQGDMVSESEVKVLKRENKLNYLLDSK
jgi:hypothetical protein